jgi:hypothetical protein
MILPQRIRPELAMVPSGTPLRVRLRLRGAAVVLEFDIRSE